MRREKKNETHDEESEAESCADSSNQANVGSAENYPVDQGHRRQSKVWKRKKAAIAKRLENQSAEANENQAQGESPFHTPETHYN